MPASNRLPTPGALSNGRQAAMLEPVQQLNYDTDFLISAALASDSI